MQHAFPIILKISRSLSWNLKKKRLAEKKSIKDQFLNWFKIRLNYQKARELLNVIDFPQWSCLCFSSNGWEKTYLGQAVSQSYRAVSYEIPAGKLEVGENTDPVAAALRELEEETAYTGKLELLYDFLFSHWLL